MARIGYYAHAHGSGHCRYADYVGSLLDDKVTVFTSRDFAFAHVRDVVRLPSDVMADDELQNHLLDPPKYLHYAPVGFAPILERSRRVLDAVQERNLDLVLVDVSAEIATLLRASSVPYLYVKMPGYRTDPAHEEAYRGALGLVAYYPEILETPFTPSWVREKTIYLGFRPDNTTGAAVPDLTSSLRARHGIPQNRPLLSVITGFGGSDAVEQALPDIRRAYPEYYILGVGNLGIEASKYLDSNEGMVADIRPYLVQSNVVVGACGNNLVTEALRSRVPFVPIPCTRPHREQEAIAEALYRAGLCTSLHDFLAGEPPKSPSEKRLRKVMKHHYPTYFDRLATATDWRDLRAEVLAAENSETGF